MQSILRKKVYVSLESHYKSLQQNQLAKGAVCRRSSDHLYFEMVIISTCAPSKVNGMAQIIEFGEKTEITEIKAKLKIVNQWK